MHHLHPDRRNRQRLAQGSRQLVHPRPDCRDYGVRIHRSGIRIYPNDTPALRPYARYGASRHDLRSVFPRPIRIRVCRRNRIGIAGNRLVNPKRDTLQVRLRHEFGEFHRREGLYIHPKLPVHLDIRPGSVLVALPEE